jgi:hypothetical protein
VGAARTGRTALYFIYVDESGTKDPRITGTRRDGTTFEKDCWLYVLVGVSLFEMKWFRFEYAVNRMKLGLLERIYRDEGVRLELADTEVKSRWVRIPKERAEHPFLSRLTPDELTALVDLYMDQLPYHAVRVFAVVMDKRHLHSYMDREMLHRKSYELLIERV